MELDRSTRRFAWYDHTKLDWMAPCPVPDCDNVHIPNLPLLRKVYEHISTNRKEWDQSVWGKVVITLSGALGERARDTRGRFIKSNAEKTICKTAFCFAGHAVSMAGYEIMTDQGVTLDQLIVEPGLHVDLSLGDAETDFDEVLVPGITERTFPIEVVAAHELGLTREEADRLFSGGNHLSDIKSYCNAIAAVVGEKFLG